MKGLIKLLILYMCAVMAFQMSDVSVSAQNGKYSVKTGQKDTLIKNIVLWDVSGYWKKDNTGWQYRYTGGGFPSSEWLKIKNQWYFFDESGYAVKGWQIIAEKKYYFNNDNQMVTGWVYSDSSWYYMGSSGAMQTGWVKVNGSWYYMDPESGAMQTGWLEADGTWYYMNSSGKMQTGWICPGSWYYMASNGKMQTGWLYDNGYWYYLNPDTGAMQTGWIEVNGDWYHMSSSGKMETGWIRPGNWYYLASNGKMQTGWLYDNGNWYYLNPETGGLKTGWLELDGTWYYLKTAGGAMVTDVVYIDGKYQEFQSSGAWIGRVEAAGREPVYYSQRDSRWSSLVFGKWNLYSTGCVPSSLAMIFSALKNETILPSEIATWLYNNTQEFNRRSVGGGGLCTVYASDHWGLKSKGLGSLSALETELDAGRMVIAYQGPGLFASSGSHAIVLYGYSSGSSYAYDPWNSGRNGWYKLSTLWSQRSTDPDDNKGGYTYYSVYK